MLPERYRQLLTACVDGELNRRQRRRVERLLKRSPEARQVLQKLLGDARALRQLPPTPPPANLAEAVLTQIHERRLRPSRHARLNNPPALPAWTGLAAAAAVLLILGVGSYLYFAASFLSPSPTSVARVPLAYRGKRRAGHFLPALRAPTALTGGFFRASPQPRPAGPAAPEPFSPSRSGSGPAAREARSWTNRYTRGSHLHRGNGAAGHYPG
jgi:anti-sigma factor RsiW